LRRDIRPVLIRFYYWNLLLSTLLLLSPLPLAAQATPQAALASALQGTPGVGLVVDVKTGRQVAVVRAAEATNERHTPGSILKPLFLADALEQHEVQPETTVFCRRDLHVSDGSREWNLACTHPQSDVAFASKEALAYSCNRDCAELADRIPPAQAAAILAHYGLGPAPIPQNREQKELLVLGVAGISVSPAQMASAYRKLALDEAKVPAVREGLRDSVSYGMAHNAGVPGMEIAATEPTPPGWRTTSFSPRERLRRKALVPLPSSSSPPEPSRPSRQRRWNGERPRRWNGRRMASGSLPEPR
jgi:hypothetical protein